MKECLKLKQLTGGGTLQNNISLIKDERGSILPITAGIIFVAIALVCVVVDFGRYSIAKEKLQTAGDAAALAGAKTGYRYVQLEIDPGSYYDPCCSTDEDGNCQSCCPDCGDEFTVSGREADLLDNNGWEDYCCSCGCGGMEVLDRWVEYDNHTDVNTATNTLFELNKPEEMDTVEGGNSGISIDIHGNRSDPLYPSVIVRAQGSVKTLMMDFFKMFDSNADFSYLDASTCSQGATYIRDLNNGRWTRPPSSLCSE